MTSLPGSPHLPLELERVIFLLALEDDSNQTKNLVMIAKRVFEWLIPQIYNIARLSVDASTYTPIKFNESAYQRYGHHVHHLLIEHDDYKKYLPLFPSITNLAFWIDWDPIYLPHVLQLPLTSISIEWSTDLIPIFQKVTHLDLIDLIDEVDWKAIKDLYLPKLTHICLLSSLFKQNIEWFLDRKRCPELRVMVMWRWGLGEPHLDENHEPIADDKRLVAVRCNGRMDWERGAKGEIDSWRFAEGVIASRQ